MTLSYIEQHMLLDVLNGSDSTAQSGYDKFERLDALRSLAKQGLIAECESDGCWDITHKGERVANELV